MTFSDAKELMNTNFFKNMIYPENKLLINYK